MIYKFKAIFSGRYFRNVCWLGGAELFNRIFRLAILIMQWFGADGYQKFRTFLYGFRRNLKFNRN